MNQKCDVPLESYRLAQYALQVPCFVCEGPNAFDTELCRHCFAPMAVTHRAAEQKLSPQMIGVLGCSDAGKTVYLGMLMDILSRQVGALRARARGAFSITLQQTTTASLAQCEFPQKTPNEPDQWNWVHCLLSQEGRRQETDLVLPDMAGEAISQEIDHPGSYPVVRSLLSKCCGILLLVDAGRLLDGRHDPDHFALKVMTFLSELKVRSKVIWPNRPIGIVFSKADQSETCFDDPKEFARQHLPAVWKLSQQQFHKIKYFASGVAGACAYRTVFPRDRIRVPLRVEPRGVVEPLTWLVSELPKPEKSKLRLKKMANKDN